MQGRMVAESCVPVAVLSEVTRRHDISPQHLFAWRKTARACLLRLPADEAPLFVPVVTQPRRDGATAAVVDDSGDIAIEIGGGVVVRHAVSTSRGCGMFCAP
jgi:transposase